MFWNWITFNSIANYVWSMYDLLQTDCTSNQITCSFGQFIPAIWFCYGYPDCTKFGSLLTTSTHLCLLLNFLKLYKSVLSLFIQTYLIGFLMSLFAAHMNVWNSCMPLGWWNSSSPEELFHWLKGIQEESANYSVACVMIFIICEVWLYPTCHIC